MTTDESEQEIKRLRSLVLDLAYESDGKSSFWCQICRARLVDQGKRDEPHHDWCVVKELEEKK